MENTTIDQMKEQLTRLEQNIAHYGKEIARLTEKTTRYTDIATTSKWLKEAVDEHRALTKALKAAEKAEKEAAKQAKETAKLEFLKRIKGAEVLEEYLNEMYQSDLNWYENICKSYEEDPMSLGKTERVFARMSRQEAERIFQDDLTARRYDILRRVADKVGNIESLDLRRNEKLGLDGWVVGDKGTASLTTIGVGGYNIVRYHFRTLVQ